jgi:hypothetical protein
VFGRRKHQEQEEAAREAERRALFEELAKRPDTICPFLGLEQARTEYRDRVSDGHRCYAFGDPAELSAEQQQKVCLQRGYGNCPRYLRGVLVIPTEELEALRHPQPAPPPPLAPPVKASPPPERRGRRGLAAVVLGLLLLGGGGVAAFVALGGAGFVAQQSPTPSPRSTAPAASPSEAASSTPGPTPQPTPEPTPVVVPSSSALPTPGADDVATGFALNVSEGRYPTLLMDGDGNVEGTATAVFDGSSWAPVQRLEYQGDVYWRTLQGGYLGLSYSRALSSGFIIYQTFETPSGEPRFRQLDEDEY